MRSQTIGPRTLTWTGQSKVFIFCDARHLYPSGARSCKSLQTFMYARLHIAVP
jgi:hypothetical protein